MQKTYLVVLSGVLSDAQVDRLRKPVLLDDGKCPPFSVSVYGKAPHATVLSITVKEGKKPEIRIFARQRAADPHAQTGRRRRVELGVLQSGNGVI